MAAKKTVDTTTTIEHDLVPKHEILSDKDAKEVLDQYNITVAELPKIFKTDPAIRHLEPKPGAVVRITRPSMSAGETVFYRTVVGE